MLEVTLLFVACFLITVVLFEFARWLWVYYAVGSAARQGASYATAHGVDSASPADKGKIQEVAREAFTTHMPDLIPQDLVVHTSWMPDNEIFSRVQVQTEYNFQFITAQLIFSKATIPLLRASPVMVINPSPAKAQSTKNRAVIKSWSRPRARKLAISRFLLPPLLCFQYGPAGISHQPTVEARAKPAIASLRLLAVRDVGFKYARIVQETERRAARLVLAAFSRTSPRHVVRNAG